MTVPSPLYRLTGEPAPPAPVLVVALEGWIDAGLAGGTAMASLFEAVESSPYAVFDTGTSSTNVPAGQSSRSSMVSTTGSNGRR